MDDRLMRQGTRTLNPGELLRLRDAAGRHLGVVRGAVWITQFGDRRDHVIEAGSSFRFDRDGVAVVQALDGEAVVVLEADIAGAGDRWRGAQQHRDLRLADLRQEASRLRTEAVNALLAAAADRLSAAFRRVVDRATRAFRARPAGRGAVHELGRLNDHVLRDLGLSRDQLPLAGRATPCLHC